MKPYLIHRTGRTSAAVVSRIPGSRSGSVLLAVLLVWIGLQAATVGIMPARAFASFDLMSDVHAMAQWSDRRTGTSGNAAAADYILAQFTSLGIEQVNVHQFLLPVLNHQHSRVEIVPSGAQGVLAPLRGNAISPGTIAPEGLTGPLVYAGQGRLKEFNGKQIEGAVVLMEMDSGRNWLNAANLGARALIYVDRNRSIRSEFKQKDELSPINFPRFWMPLSEARKLFGPFENPEPTRAAPRVRLTSDTRWGNGMGQNIYALIPGQDQRLGERLLIVEAFYDSSAWVLGQSPGADEACGIATLLALARYLRQHPPARSVLLVATDAHGEMLAGMRELVWSLRARTRDMRQFERSLKAKVKQTEGFLKVLEAWPGPGARPDDQQTDKETILIDALSDELKSEVDRISRQLMVLRMQSQDEQVRTEIQQLAQARMTLRQLGWRASLDDLTREEAQALKALMPLATRFHQTVLQDAKKQLKLSRSARRLRSLVAQYELDAFISLHLSSHGDGVGAFNQGWLHSLKPNINRIAAYTIIEEVLRQVAAETEQAMGLGSMFQDTLRPSRLRSWQSYLPDQPALGGELSALAGYTGLTLATLNDARPQWGTPYDRPEQVDVEWAVRQGKLVCGIIHRLANVPKLASDSVNRNGFSMVSGRVNLLRHGELFPDQPADGTVILAFQGQARYHAWVDALGTFQLRGVADKKHVLDKVILEGYRFDPDTGAVVWAIDKKQTGKPAYRVKMQRRSMETDLVMFGCRQSTMFGLLEPRTFRYMTKLQLLDGRLDAPPRRYWWSRIDTRESTIASIYLEPGTPFKMTLSDTVLRNKLILTKGSAADPEGTGYLIDEYPFLHRTTYKTASDMWTLLAPRVANLEEHGIFDERIRGLQTEGMASLDHARQALSDQRYDEFSEAASRSWALASRVYDSVQKTQKDVLFGVLFYIALFVPFSFCMERFLFSFADIHKRIIAFSLILLLLIGVIYKVHPAFQLAYSPMVVILAFFIMGLSLIVTLIIFFRFEDEMVLLQRRVSKTMGEDLSRWKAFAAAFFLGVNNLHRRRLRTTLTCLTLIILTFTIMSFTAVKTARHHARLLYHPSAPYTGLLIKNVNWTDLPPEALGILANSFEYKAVVAPRVWLEEKDRTRASRVPVVYGSQRFDAQGMVGLSSTQAQVTAVDQILLGGRWLRPTDRSAVLLPERMALSLGIDPARPAGNTVHIWGMPFEVVGVYSGKALQEQHDLDGEPLTPVTFPSEASKDMTDVEMEAIESGEDVKEFQSRYQHISADMTVIVPYRTLLAAGGHLKAVAIRPASAEAIPELARDLVDRFGLSLFSGEPGGNFLYHASDTISYSGVPNILIPLLISIFIVLNTMISSVYERKREIGIYTSVGLAPSHVAFLFIAEALAFAVLSVVLGYLLAQTTASLFGGTALWSGITVNYSSLAGVAAMVLVILVVLVSVIYPSRVAAEIAIPDVNRSWTMPDPKENTIELTLPFLMSHQEHSSVAGFLYTHFKGHQDITHGLFSTDRIQADRLTGTPQGQGATADDQGDCYQLKSNVWLAPFDFGISQQVLLRFYPSPDDPSRMEILLRLERQSGEANAWGRLNKVFVNNLRKQLLVWRSLDQASQRHYAQLLDTPTRQPSQSALPQPAGAGKAA